MFKIKYLLIFGQIFDASVDGFVRKLDFEKNINFLIDNVFIFSFLK